jgi:hypothetical protein
MEGLTMPIDKDYAYLEEVFGEAVAVSLCNYFNSDEIRGYVGHLRDERNDDEEEEEEDDDEIEDEDEDEDEEDEDDD